MGGGGGARGQVKFYPYEKGHAEEPWGGGGGQKKFWVVFPWKLEVLAILTVEAQKVSTL